MVICKLHHGCYAESWRGQLPATIIISFAYAPVGTCKEKEKSRDD